jgi:hypothetical protein
MLLQGGMSVVSAMSSDSWSILELCVSLMSQDAQSVGSWVLQNPLMSSHSKVTGSHLKVKSVHWIWEQLSSPFFLPALPALKLKVLKEFLSPGRLNST